MLATGQNSIAASALFPVADADGDPMTAYYFQDTGAGGEHFVFNGVDQASNTQISITAAQLSSLTYMSGSAADTLYVAATDGYTPSGWSNPFTVSPHA